MSTLAPSPDVPTSGPRTPRDLVAAYAVAVRGALADLPDETVEDLTDGLEADLLDALADDDAPHRGAHGPAAPGPTADTLVALFGAPAGYADELRAAAGLAPRRAASTSAADGSAADPGATRRPVRAAVRALARDTRASWAASARAVRHSPHGAPVFDLLGSLRPVWWVVRAWVAVTVVTWTREPVAALPQTPAVWLALLVAVVVSVQFGRGRWSFPPRQRWVGRLLTVAAVVLLVPTAFAISDDGALPGAYSRGYSDGLSASAPGSGVFVDGDAVGNLFVYDAQGRPVPDAQVYDDRGRPVVTSDDVDGDGFVELGESQDTWQLSPALDVNGARRWNVFPLRGLPLAAVQSEDDPAGATGDDGSLAVPVTPPAPFAQAPAIAPDAGRVPAPTDPDAVGSTPSAPATGPTPAPSATHAPSDSATTSSGEG